MTRYLLDTGSAGDYIHRRGDVYPRAKAKEALGDHIGICVPVLGELWAGIELSATRDRNRTRLLRELPRLALWPYDKAAAKEFGRLFALLQRIGRPMQQIDIQVAAIAITMGNCIVVSSDGDLKAIPGLKVENWSAP